MCFDGGGEEAPARAWDPALPGVLDSHRASWKSVWLRTGWGSPQQPLSCPALKALGRPPPQRLSEEEPILTLTSPSSPGNSLSGLHVQEKHTQIWMPGVLFLIPLAQICLVIMRMSICPLPLWHSF